MNGRRITRKQHIHRTGKHLKKRSIKRRTLKRKSTRRKSVRRKSTRRKSVRRKSIRKKSNRKVGGNSDKIGFTVGAATQSVANPLTNDQPSSPEGEEGGDDQPEMVSAGAYLPNQPASVRALLTLGADPAVVPQWLENGLKDGTLTAEQAFVLMVQPDGEKKLQEIVRLREQLAEAKALRPPVSRIDRLMRKAEALADSEKELVVELEQTLDPSEALTAEAELKVAKAKGFATFNQFQAHLGGLKEEDQTALVGEIRAEFRAELKKKREDEAFQRIQNLHRLTRSIKEREKAQKADKPHRFCRAAKAREAAGHLAKARAVEWTTKCKEWRTDYNRIKAEMEEVKTALKAFEDCLDDSGSLKDGVPEEALAALTNTPLVHDGAELEWDLFLLLKNEEETKPKREEEERAIFLKEQQLGREALRKLGVRGDMKQYSQKSIEESADTEHRIRSAVNAEIQREKTGDFAAVRSWAPASHPSSEANLRNIRREAYEARETEARVEDWRREKELASIKR